MQLSELGPRIDGWADLIDGAGDKATSVLQHLADTIAKRENTLLRSERMRFTTGTLNSQDRLFLLIQMSNGAAVMAYVGTAGKDLYASWSLYVRPLVNWVVVLLIAGLALLVNAPLVLMSLASSMSDAMRYLGASGFVVLGSLFGGLVSLIVTLVVFFAIAAVISRAVKGNALAFAFKELTPFDGDDIAAMALAVHHSMLQALDDAGVDVKILRLKEQFRAGARERLF